MALIIFVSLHAYCTNTPEVGFFLNLNMLSVLYLKCISSEIICYVLKVSS